MRDNTTHIVLLLHGIRDMGGWQERVKQSLEQAIPGLACVKVRYGWFGPLSFISPLAPAGKAYAKLHQQYQRAKRDYPQAKISIIAHSFGTHLTGRLLRENPDASFHRILFCGGVLSREFDWRSYRDRYGVGVTDATYAVLNECGNRDPWPIFAESISGRYGASGAYGFEAAYRLEERHYEGDHSLFFDRDHIEQYWIPFLQGIPLGQNTALHRQPKLLERLLLSLPCARLALRCVVALCWLVISLWWLWGMAGAGLVYCQATGSWPFAAEPPLCARHYAAIDYSQPADFPLVNPANDPRFPDRMRVVNYEPRIPAGKVTLEYANETKFDLWLLLFDCSHFYAHGGTPWLALPAVAGAGGESSDAFQSSSGWYAIYAYRTELGQPIWLRLLNLRNSKLTTLTIRCQNELQVEVRE